MTEYRVVWEIDVEAESPEEAAEMALEFQRDSTSLATVFEVFEASGRQTRVDVDITGTKVVSCSG